MKHHVTPAVALGLVAVVLAASGTATAAGLVTGRQIKNSSITGTDVKNRSLTASDFKGSVQGPSGAPGAAGVRGAAGPSGTVSATIEADGPATPLGAAGTPTTVAASKAECPPGTVVVVGGFETGARTFIGAQEKSGNGYFVVAINVGPLATSIKAQAICGVGPTNPRPSVSRVGSQPRGRSPRAHQQGGGGAVGAREGSWRGSLHDHYRPRPARRARRARRAALGDSRRVVRGSCASEGPSAPGGCNVG
jgi:hypothetical protein